jgi:dephospho-CoA kinase
LVPSPAVILVGLTGGIGSGKSTVSAALEARGAILIDADRIVRDVQAPGQPVFDAIVELFGARVVAADGTLDRAAVAAIVFNDPDALRELNAIVHPAVGAEMQRQIDEYRGTDHVLVLDIPLLVEGARGRYPVVGVLVVDTPVEVAVERLVRFRGMSEGDARARVAKQASRQQRLAAADRVIDNSGSMEALEAQVDEAWAWMQTLPPEPVAPREPKLSS